MGVTFMADTNTMVEMMIPLNKVKENSVKVIGLLLSIMELEKFGNSDITYKIIVRYSDNNILCIDNSVDMKILKSILYYIKLRGSDINLVTKEYSNGDIITVAISNIGYKVKVNKKYSDIINKKIELLEICSNTLHDTVDCIKLEGIDKNLLVSTISKHIKVKDCFNITVEGLMVNIIKSTDIILLIDIDNIYIVDLYGDFKAEKKVIQNDIIALINHKNNQLEEVRSEYCFI